MSAGYAIATRAADTKGKWMGAGNSETGDASGSAARDPNGVELFRKANAVLLLLQRGGEWTAQQLADAAGEPVSSTYRMIANLREIRLVDKGISRGGFRLGLYAMELGAVCDDRLNLRGACAPWLEWLQRETTATSFLMLRRGYRAVCIDRIVGKGVRSLALQLGGSLPLYAGAGPRALLANLPEAELADVLAHFEALREDSPEVPDRRQLERTIKAIRAEGISLSDEDITPGVAAVGAPVFNHRGELEAAISVSGARAALFQGRERTIEVVQEAAAGISANLGYRGADAPTEQRVGVH